MGIKKDIKIALANCDKEISDIARRPYTGPGPNYAAGLSAEGYSGGYRDALHDVMLAMNRCRNNNSRYWRKE